LSFTVSHSYDTQGEHKNNSWFQVVIKSKLTGIFFYKYGTADTLPADTLTQEIVYKVYATVATSFVTIFQ
jgi:hypothetical protein